MVVKEITGSPENNKKKKSNEYGLQKYVACPVIQANGRLTIEDELRSGSLLRFDAR